MSIKLTTPAAKQVKNYLAADGGMGLRLGVQKTGCSGWAYTVQLAREIDADDLVFEDHGVKVVVSRDSIDYLDGSEIDFVNEGLSTVFKFNNPNATDECGCGESFTID